MSLCALCANSSIQAREHCRAIVVTLRGWTVWQLKRGTITRKLVRLAVHHAATEWPTKSAHHEHEVNQLGPTSS